MKKFRDFKSAREFVQKLELKSFKEWQEYCKSGNRPEDIPANLVRTYKNDGYIDLGDFLGTGNIANYNKQYLPFLQAREFVQKLELKSFKEWQEYCKSGNKPDDVSTNPNKTYKNDFKGYGDWLGTGRTRDWRPFKEAREFVQKLGLKNNLEWKEYCTSGNKPDDIPSHPWDVYKEWNEKLKKN